MRGSVLLRRFAAAGAVALVVSACAPRFDVEVLEAELAAGAAGGAAPGAVTDGGTGDGAAPVGTPTVAPSGGATELTGGDAVASGGTGGSSDGAGGGDGGGGDGGTGSTTTPGTTGGGGGGGGASAATDPGPRPGVTDEPCKPNAANDDAEHINPELGCIKIGVLVPETGAAPVPSDFRSGVSLYWWEKAAAGGTHGRQVQLIVEDTESNTNTATAKAQKLLQEGVFTIVSLDRLEVQQVIGDFMERANVPHIMVQAPTPYPTDWVNTFTISIDHTLQGRGIAEHWAKDLGAAQGKRPVAIVREQTPALKPGADALVARAKDFGMNVAFVETIDPTQTSFTNTVLKICPQSGRPEIVWLYMAPTPALTIMQQAATQGCNPVWFANSISWNLDLAQTNPAAPEDSGAFSPWVSVQHPRAAKYRAAYQKYNGSAADDLGLASWGLSEVVDSALEATGPNLGRDSFRTALQNLKVDRYETWGPIDCSGGPPYVCAKHVAVYEDAGTTWSMVGDFRTFG